MDSNDKISFGDFHNNMANRPGYDDSEYFLHLPNPMNYYAPLSTVSDKAANVALSASSSNKIYSPRLYEVSRNVTSDRNAADYDHEQSRINSDVTLNYIYKMLMEEDTDDRVTSYHGDTALQAMEEPFYELLGQKYPILPPQLPLCGCDHIKNLNDSTNESNEQSCSSCSSAARSANISSSNNFIDSVQAFQVPWSVSVIAREEKQFIQHSETMDVGLEMDCFSITEKHWQGNYSPQMNGKYMRKHALFEVQGQNSYPCTEDLYFSEGRSSKQFAMYSNEPIRDEMLDKVLLYSENRPLDESINLQETMAKCSEDHQGKTSGRRKTRGKRQQKKDVVDLRILLTHCAQAVAESNHSLASDILKMIRQHASPSGDDSQRLAFFLAYCLEVRLAGTGSQIYHKLITKERNVELNLDVFKLGFAICPFLRAPYCFSNKTILDVSKGKTQVHIIDFGICYGFQWPALFENFAKREEGPPRLRITGVELPRPGFRPYEMRKNTGLRLADYANKFKIPFEYRHISSKWDDITSKDFSIEDDEVLVVSCIYRMKNLGDETMSINSARSKVLSTIRTMKPKVFLHGVMNGSFSSPFFLTRFKEVMYHYTTLFDMLDKIVPRDNKIRMILEGDVYHHTMLNAIACEGLERIERPEGYKKWKVRNLNAGFVQLPLNQAIVKETQDTVRKFYHKDFVVDEEDQWLVLGWKGRITYALSTWKANESDDGD